MDDDDSTVEYPDWESAHIQNFLTELAEMILKSGADGVYGLARYPGDGFPGRTEITVGRANVNLTPKQAAKYDWSGGQSEAAWYYEGGFYKRSCGCACLSHHTSESHHQHYVPSTFEG